MRGGSFGIGKTHHRVSVKRRFEEEDFLNARDDVRDHHPIGCVGVLFRLRRVLIAPRERGAKRETAKEQKREQKRRTMETSFVVSAAFWAPVVTESQNDMAVFLAIRVWTEMVADFCDDDAASRKEAKEKKFSVSSRGREKSLATSSITRITIT